jgi:hypothetical protein
MKLEIRQGVSAAAIFGMLAAGFSAGGCIPGDVGSGNLPIVIPEGADFDEAALKSALAEFIPDDLSAFNFRVFFAVQNASGAEMAFKAVVDGAPTGTRRVADSRQTIVVVQTSNCPGSVRFEDFVTGDGSIIESINFDQAESTNLTPEEGASRTYACPSVIVLVVKSTSIEAFSFDRNIDGIESTEIASDSDSQANGATSG